MLLIRVVGAPSGRARAFVPKHQTSHVQPEWDARTFSAVETYIRELNSLVDLRRHGSVYPRTGVSSPDCPLEQGFLSAGSVFYETLRLL
jgi:hypothetical protein